MKKDKPKLKVVPDYSVGQQRMIAIFDEWARLYAINPDDYGDVIKEGKRSNKPVKGYGEQCMLMFHRIAKEMDAAGLLPLPVKEKKVKKKK